MTRESEAQLLDFCVRQRCTFEESAWLRSESVEQREMAAVCLFLAGVDWFGHRDALLRVANQLLGGVPATFGALARALKFDCLRFSSMLRRRLNHA